MKIDNDQEAARLINDTNYGLTAAVYTQDLNFMRLHWRV